MPDTEIVEVMVFGDSITYGAWDSHGGWVQRLREPIDVKNLVDVDVAYFVYNLGVVDDTSEGILKRFEAEMEARHYANTVQERIVIFNTGLNDSEIIVKKKASRVPKPQFEKNIDRLIGLAKKYAHKIVFIGPTPVDEQRAVPLPWDDDLAYKNKIVKEYDGIIRAVCNRRKVHFLEVFDEWIKLDYKTLIEDGVHLSPAGHLVMYELVRNFLEKNKILNFATPKTNKKLRSSKESHH